MRYGYKEKERGYNIAVNLHRKKVKGERTTFIAISFGEKEPKLSSRRGKKWAILISQY